MAGENAIVFFHSALCPRCRISGLALRRVLRSRPDLEVTKVEFLTHREAAREAGVRSIPTLVANGRILSGIVLTPAMIERFLGSLDGEPS